MLKIRRPLGRLIFNMGIAIPGKTVFLIETAPWFTALLKAQTFMCGRQWWSISCWYDLWACVLTLWGLVMLIFCGKQSLVQVMAWYHYLLQSIVIISVVLCHSPGCNFSENAHIIMKCVFCMFLCIWNISTILRDNKFNYFSLVDGSILIFNEFQLNSDL